MEGCGHALPQPSLLTPSIPCLQPSSSAALASSSAPRASAPTLPSSVMGTTTARTTVMRPIAVRGLPTSLPPTLPQDLRVRRLKLALPAGFHQPWSLHPPPSGNGHPPHPSLVLTHTPILTDIHVCLPSQFKCTNTNRCIPGIFRCNGQDNCGDGEDERDCRKCPGQQVGGTPLLTSVDRPISSIGHNLVCS